MFQYPLHRLFPVHIFIPNQYYFQPLLLFPSSAVLSYSLSLAHWLTQRAFTTAISCATWLRVLSVCCVLGCFTALWRPFCVDVVRRRRRCHDHAQRTSFARTIRTCFAIHVSCLRRLCVDFGSMQSGLLNDPPICFQELLYVVSALPQ